MYSWRCKHWGLSLLWATRLPQTLIYLSQNSPVFFSQISMDKPPARIRAVRLPNDPFLQVGGDIFSWFGWAHFLLCWKSKLNIKLCIAYIFILFMYDLGLVCHIETQTETKCPNLIIKQPTLLHFTYKVFFFFFSLFIQNCTFPIVNSF